MLMAVSELPTAMKRRHSVRHSLMQAAKMATYYWRQSTKRNENNFSLNGGIIECGRNWKSNQRVTAEGVLG
jgi:hypothetical protein